MADGDGDVYVNGYHPSVLKAHSWRTAENSCGYLLPVLKEKITKTPQIQLLDVGCGSGSITIGLAAYFPQGKATGVDISEEPLKYAAALASQAGRTNVDFRTGSIYELDFPNDTFDVVHTSQTIIHLKDQVGAVRELLRVCKPGGVVAIRDGLLHTYSIWPDYPWFERMTSLWALQLPDPMSACKLRATCIEAGAHADDLKSSAGCYTWASPEERRIHAESAAARVLESNFKDFALKHDTNAELLEGLADGWKTWAEDPTGWMAIMNAEIMVTKR